MNKILKKTTILVISLWLLTVASVSEAVWRLDEDPDLAEPRNFRMASDDWRVEPEDEPPSREGLDTLRASGSAQCTADGFAALYETLAAAAPGAPIYDVDLRQESHGFVDGIPVSWFEERNQANAGKTPEEALADETERL
ncbi:MAG: protein tyrosine phosphatase, partial [Schwartzia sp.]|nr:protein tyrosine phosphatase [Schwartzia sp. (in: firmicutes)]